MSSRFTGRALTVALAALIAAPFVPASPVRAAEATTTAIESSINPSTYGQGVTFTATVTAGVGTPTGSVQFTVDGANLGTAVTLSDGTGTSIAVTTLTAGTHPVTAVYTSDDPANYVDSSGSLSGGQVVDPATLTVTPDPRAVTYGAAEPAYTFGISGFVLGQNQGTAAGFVAPGCDSDYTPTTPVASSPRTISCSGGSASNYDFSYPTANLTISKADQVITFTSTPPAAATVGGPSYTPTATAGSGDPVVFTIDGASASVCTIGAGVVSFIGPGTCTIDANEDGNANWNPAPQVQQSFGIGQASTTTSVGSSGSPTTYGTSVTFGVTVSPPAATGTVTIKDGVTTLGTCSLAGGGCTYATSALDAGSHSITAVYGGSGGYLGSTSTPIIQAVDPKPLTVTGITASSRVYDGTTGALLNTTGAALVGVVGGDTVTLGTGAATGTFASKAVGNGKTVTVLGLTLGGADSGNYSLVQPTTTATITARSLTVTATGVNKAYDGTTDATVTLSDNRVAGDVLSATYTSASFLDKNVGTGKLVNVSGISISGADAGNYTLDDTTAVTAASIAKATLTVTATADNKVYDGTTTATVAFNDNRMAGDTLAHSYIAATFASRHFGTGKTVTVSGISISGADAGNYALTSTTAVTTADITRRPISVTAVTSTKVYDGTTSSAGIPTITSGTLAAGDSATWTQAFASKTVGTGKTLTPAGAVADGNGGANYDVTLVPNATGAITAKTLTVTGITSPGKVYDGTTTAPLSVGGATLVGRVAGDTTTTLVTSGATGTYADKNVGTGKAVAVAGLSITGADASNYSLVQPSTTASITKAPLVVSADPLSRPYGDPNPVLTASYTGFVGGETLGTSGVTGSPSCTTTALVTSGVGPYPIDCGLGTLASSNYSITVTDGTLTIERAPLTLRADDQTREYGLPNPTLTASFDLGEFKNGQTPAGVLSGAPACSTTVLVSDDAGPYVDAITCIPGTLTAANYAIQTLVPGTLTITPALAAPVISADRNPAAATALVTLTAAVTWPTGTPTGTVTFFEGATDLSGPLVISSGSVGLQVSWAEAGEHDITAVYSGDGANFGTATSSPFRVVVGKSDVAVTVTANRPTWETNVPITFTATLVPTASGVTQAVSGTVAFRVDGALKATQPVVGATATYTTKLAAGSHSVVAEFTPDTPAADVFNPGISSPLTKAVVANTVAASGVGRSSAKVFPVKDDWMDTVTIRGTRLEPISVTIKIYSPSGKKVRTMTRGASTGAYAYAWNGRLNGKLLPAGTYKVVQVLKDAYGAKAKHTSYVKLVTKRMYWYRKTVKVAPGPRNYQARSTGDTSVLAAPSGKSTKPVVMRNATGNPAWIAAGYQFTLPSAKTYRSVSFRVTGSWTGTTAPKIGLIPWNGGNWSSMYFTDRARTALGTSASTWYRQTLTSLGGIRSGRSIRAAIDSFAGPSGYSAGPYVYSITAVKLVVRYGILR